MSSRVKAQKLQSYQLNQMAQLFCEWGNKKGMKIDWVALVQAHQDYFDFKKAEIARLIESVIIFEKRLSELEIRFAEWQDSQMNVLDMR